MKNLLSTMAIFTLIFACSNSMAANFGMTNYDQTPQQQTPNHPYYDSLKESNQGYNDQR